MSVPSVRTQAVLGSAVIAVVLLFALWPGRGRPPGVTAQGVSAHYSVRVHLPHPGTAAGEIDLAVHGRDASAAAPDQVTVDAVMPSMGHAMPALTARPDGSGGYRADGQLFLMPGEWTVSVRLHTAGGTEVVTVPVSVPAG